MDYAGTSMSFRLVRGMSAEEVFDCFRNWEAEEKKQGEPLRIEKKNDCKMEPSPTRRQRGTLQCATFRASRDMSDYGDRYFVVVRNEAGWSEELSQRFAVAVELRHQAEIRLYERIRLRIRA
jgi:hypothetical protein